MAAEKKSFMLYFDSFVQWQLLNIEQRGLLITALFEYTIEGKELETEDGMLKLAFSFIRSQIDRDSNKYEETCKKRAESIKKRWENAKNTNEYNCIQTNTKNTNVYNCISEDTKHTDTDTEKETDTDIVTVTDIEKETDNNIIMSKKVKTKRFVKPTVEEIKAYCIERNNNIDAERFFDYYEANGWKVSGNAMKDWKATVRNWERNEKARNKRLFL